MTVKKGITKKDEQLGLFKLLADQRRYEVAALLMRNKGALSVGEIAETVGMGHSALSHLLGRLHGASIVTYKKSGREVLYEFAKTPVARRVARLLQLS